jgi:hypothetical protein
MTAFTDGLLSTLATKRPTEADLLPEPSAEALAAWEAYRAIPTNYDGFNELSEQEAFCDGFDLGRQVNR